MSIATLESREKQYARKLNQLNKDLAASISKENDAVKKSTKATIKRQKARAESQVNSSTRELNRENDKIAAEKKKQADLQKKISDANNKINTTRIELSKARSKENKKVLEEIEKRNKHEISKILNSPSQNSIEIALNKNLEHDIFFSYAHEDSDYADDLVNMMKAAGIDVVFDKNDLKWGETIIDFIDSHLRTVKFAIVLITPSYLEKYWTQYELKTLLQRHSQSNGRSNLILPIWHNVTKDEIASRSLALTDFNALVTTLSSKEEIVKKVQELLN